MQRTLTAAVAAVALFLAPAALAQNGTGDVKGSVYDASHSAVPDSTVRLTSLDTNIVRDTKANSDGAYYFGAVPNGRYKLEVERTGFKKWSSEFDLAVGQTVAIDVGLEVGSVQNTVVVNDAAPLIETEGMQISDVKDSSRIHQLPLNGRQVSNLFALTPGVENSGGFRVNGLHVGATEMTLDGVSIVNRFSGSIANTQPGLDTIQEFRIETNGSSAQYLQPATITLVSKSGTNQFHGDLFEVFRNNAGGLRARARQDGNTSQKYIRNEFGVSAGGPLMLPKLYDGRNKTFWFFSYEGQRVRQNAFQQDYVPTQAMWNGNFANSVDVAGNQSIIYDPLTTNAQGVRQPFAGNVIPQNRIAPIYAKVQAATAPANLPVSPLIAPNVQLFYPNGTNYDTYTGKLDQHISDKDTLSARFTAGETTTTQTGGLGTGYGAALPTISNGFGTGRNDNAFYNATINETHIFSPSLLNQFMFAVDRQPNFSGTLADFTNWDQQLGLPNPFGALGWPTLTTSENFTWDSNNHKNQNLTAFVVDDNVTLVKGKHSISFGGRYRHELTNVRELQQAQGSNTFGSAWTGLYDPVGQQQASFTGIGLASMALGLPTFLSNQYNRGYFYFRQTEIGSYVNDSWRVTPKLTLQLGLRWDKWTPYTEKYNRLLNVDLNTVASKFQVVTPDNDALDTLPGVPPTVLSSWAARGLTWTTASQAGLPSHLLPSENLDFSPRLGAAYQLDNKTVIRAGYGEYYWTMPLSELLAAARIDPPLNLRYTNNIGSLDGTSTYAVRNVPQPAFYIGQATVSTNGNIIIPNTAQSFIPWDVNNWRDGHAREWNFTLERQLGSSYVARLSYVGDRATGLEQAFATNSQESQYNYEKRTGLTPPQALDQLRVNPNWALYGINKTGYSNTNSVQAQIEKRYSGGLVFQAYYVFTRSA
ncbi:MAG: carboxypeptidase-like regulatory domain-containing protein, partial [Bryobacteraceae bacterium]